MMCSSRVLLVVVFHSDVFEMRMLSTTWCGCMWLDSMEEPVALFFNLSRKFYHSPGFRVVYRN